MPLQIQGMAIQNQAAQLGIEHQGILNEMQGMQLNQYKDELPRFKQAVAETNGDPVALMNRVESFQSPVLQQQWTNLQKSAAQTSLGLAHNEQIKGDFQAAADLVRKGMPPPELNPDGTINRSSLAQTARAYEEHQAKIAELRTAWRYDAEGNPVALDVAQIRANAQLDAAKIRANALPGQMIEPQVKIVEGQKFLVNPKTGHWEHLEKHVSRGEFIEKHALKWAADNLMTPEQSAEALGKFYDAALSAGPAPAPAASGTKVLKWNPTTQKLE